MTQEFSSTQIGQMEKGLSEKFWMRILPKKIKNSKQKQLSILPRMQLSIFDEYPKFYKTRSIWSHEEREFTPWIKRNIDIVSNAIGEDLHSPEEQVKVSSFRVDIVAQNSLNQPIPIELQIGDSDHKHLGQLIAYTALNGVKTGVWITSHFTRGHREVIEILNESGFRFHIFEFLVIQSKPDVYEGVFVDCKSALLNSPRLLKAQLNSLQRR